MSFTTEWLEVPEEVPGTRRQSGVWLKIRLRGVGKGFLSSDHPNQGIVGGLRHRLRCVLRGLHSIRANRILKNVALHELAGQPAPLDQLANHPSLGVCLLHSPSRRGKRKPGGVFWNVRSSW